MIANARLRWLGRQFQRRRLLGVAAEASFWVFLALIPLAVVAGMIVAKFTVADLSMFDSTLLLVPAPVRIWLSNELGRVSAWKGGQVAPLSMLVFAWLASNGAHALFDAFEALTTCSRPWWKKRLLALGACVVLSIGTALVSLIFFVAGRILPTGVELLPSVGAITRTIGWAGRLAVGLSLVFLVISGLYAIGVPRSRGRRLPIWPGALVATVLHGMVGWAYGWFIEKTGDSSAYLAGLATIGITMTLLYLFTLSLLVGLAVNQSLRFVRG